MDSRKATARIRKGASQWPLTCALIVIIWVLCLIPIPETPLNDISLIDKWTHFVMYGGLCSVIWLEKAWHRVTWTRMQAFIYAALLPLFMGGLIEIVQATCTGGRRSGDILDFLTDGIGVVLGQIIGILLARAVSSWRKDS